MRVSTLASLAMMICCISFAVLVEPCVAQVSSTPPYQVTVTSRLGSFAIPNATEFIDMNDRGEVLLQTWSRGHGDGDHRPSRTYVWRDGFLKPIRIRGYVTGIFEICGLDINNLGDVVVNVNYRGNSPDPEMQARGGTYVRYADGSTEQIVPPEGKWINIHSLDDEQRAYGSLPRPDGAIVFSWKHGVYDYQSVTPPPPNQPSFTVIRDSPECAWGQPAIEHNGQVYCFGIGSNDYYAIAYINANGQILARTCADATGCSTYKRPFQYYVWSLDVRSPKNALSQLAAEINNLLLEHPDDKSLLLVAGRIARLADQDRLNLFCSRRHKIKEGLLAVSSGVDVTTAMVIHETFMQLSDKICLE